MTQFHSFLWPSNIPLYICMKSSLSLQYEDQKWRGERLESKMLLKTSLSQRHLLTAKGECLWRIFSAPSITLCLFKRPTKPPVYSLTLRTWCSEHQTSLSYSFCCYFSCGVLMLSHIYTFSASHSRKHSHPPRGGKKEMLRYRPLIFFLSKFLSLLFQSVLSHDQNSLALALKFAWVPRSLRKHKHVI